MRPIRCTTCTIDSANPRRERNGAGRDTLVAVALAAAALFAGCGAPHSLQSEPRSFAMGMTPWPYAFTDVALRDTYAAIDEHCDLVAHHLDDGVPWQECLDGDPLPNAVEVNLSDRASRLSGHAVYVAATPLAHDRVSLAGYWAEESSMPLPAAWADRAFDDPAVISAYASYCTDLIRRFEPDYFCYAIEANSPEWSDAAFADFETLIQKVYDRLSASFPDTPLFVSVVGTEDATQLDRARALMPYSDLVAVSTYPYLETGTGNPAAIPEGWFQSMAALAPEKPFAVAETGMLAETLVLDDLGARFEGSPVWQHEYVKLLLERCSRLEARFLVWFVPRDYDIAWQALRDQGFSELYALWRDTGLLDGEGRERPALARWDEWLRRPKSP
jgi:hypothetical protein